MRFRFTIRDLLWLTLAVALCLGWWLDRARLARQVEKLSFPYHSLKQIPTVTAVH